MEKQILFYQRNGQLKNKEILNNDNLQHVNGMMTKCELQDGTIEIGYFDTFRNDSENYDCNKTKDYIFL